MATPNFRKCINDDDCADNGRETNCYLGIADTTPDGSGVALADCSDLSLEELKARVARVAAVGGTPCDPDVNDNICLIPGWLRNPNGTLRGLIGWDDPSRDYYKTNPGQQYHIQGTETEIRMIPEEDVLKRVLCNYYNYNEALRDCPLQGLPLGSEIRPEQCNNCNNLFYFNNYCNSNETLRNHLADEWYDMGKAHHGSTTSSHNREDMLDRLNQIRNNCNSCGFSDFTQALNSCPQINIDLVNDNNEYQSIANINCSSCPDVFLYNNVCNNDDASRMALLTQITQNSSLSQSDRDNLLRRLIEINTYCGNAA